MFNSLMTMLNYSWEKCHGSYQNALYQKGSHLFFFFPVNQKIMYLEKQFIRTINVVTFCDDLLGTVSL